MVGGFEDVVECFGGDCVVCEVVDVALGGDCVLGFYFGKFYVVMWENWLGL